MLLLSRCVTSTATLFFFKYNLSYNFKMIFTIFNLINATHYLFIYFHYHLYYIYIYIVATLQLSHISVHTIILFLSFFPNFFSIYFFFLIFTLTLTFFPPLPFHLPTTIYFNITFHLSIHLLLFCLFLFTPFYYKIVTLFHSLHSFLS